MGKMIVVSYGRDILKNTCETLAKSDIGSYLKTDHAVSIKPNLVVARPAGGGATTHPEAVEGIIVFLKDFGVKKIKIIEGSWVGDSTKRAYKNCGYEELSKKYNIPLIDLKHDKFVTLKSGGFKIEVCEEAVNTDFLINVPVLKAHCQTRFTCCMKNLKGCISDDEKRRFHTMGLHKPIAALNALVKTGYCVVDGICGDLSFEEGGTPVEANRIIAGQNPLTVDSYCAELIGYKADEIGYLTYGKEMGIGQYYSSKTEIVELNAQDKPVCEPGSFRRSCDYDNIVTEDAACSACYSSLMFALYRLGGKARAQSKIHIGQGFKGKSGDGIGIGSCTRGFVKCVTGCPPKATDIMEMLGSRE
ncbi:MAG: DUF362 domain-containing protein [Oscillospiraceae bacterium]|nr:DUF362 domain-containing protein [Oscillospiraceae bacterium]